MNIPQPLLQSILDYLVTKPFQEVAGFVSQIQILPPDVPNPPKEVKEVKK